MPLPQPPHGIIRIRLLHQYENLPWGFGLWADMGTGADPTQGDMDTFADAVRAIWGDAIEDDGNPANVLTETSAEWHSGAGTSIKGISFTTATGTVANAPVPISACLVFSWQIAATYRGGKPRSYISAPMYGDLNGSNSAWSSSTLTAWTNHANDLFSGINALSIASQPVTLGVLSYYEDDVERGSTPPPVVRTTPLFREFLGVTVHPLVGSQRRRIPR